MHNLSNGLWIWFPPQSLNSVYSKIRQDSLEHSELKYPDAGAMILLSVTLLGELH